MAEFRMPHASDTLFGAIQRAIDEDDPEDGSLFTRMFEENRRATEDAINGAQATPPPFSYQTEEASAASLYGTVSLTDVDDGLWVVGARLQMEYDVGEDGGIGAFIENSLGAQLTNPVSVATGTPLFVPSVNFPAGGGVFPRLNWYYVSGDAPISYEAKITAYKVAEA